VSVVTNECKFDATEDYFIPKPTTTQIPHQGLTDLRQSLIQRKMITGALQIFRVEFRCLVSKEQFEALTDMTNSLKTFQCLGEERLLWQEADLCHQVASMWENRDEPDKKKVMAKIQEAEELLEKWCKLTGPSAKEALQLNLSLSLRLLRNSFTLVENPLNCFEESTRLLERMEICGSKSLNACIWIAAEAAHRLALEQNNQEYLLRFFELHEKGQQYQEQVTGNILGMVIDQYRVSQHVQYSQRNPRDLLEWIDEFFFKYPSFHLPESVYTLHETRRMILLQLQTDSESVEQSHQKIAEISELLPTKFGPLIGVRPANNGGIAAAKDGSGQFLQGSYNGEREQNFWSDWWLIIGDVKKMSMTALRLLQQWMMEDLEDGIITAQEVSSTILMPLREGLVGEQVIKDFLVDKLKAGFPAPFTDILFGDVPPAVSEWKTTFHRLSTWLQRPAKSSRSGRAYLRVVLYIVRLSALSLHKELELQVSATEEVLALTPQLPPEVQEWLRVLKFVLHRAAAFACHSLCLRGMKARDDGHKAWYQYLDKGQYHCLEAIDGNRAATDMAQLTVSLKLHAQFCLIHMYRLLSHDNFDTHCTEFLRLRHIGLKALEEVDSHHSACQLEVAWSNDLEGLQLRQRARSSFSRCETAQIAILLLHTGNPVPDETSRLKMWEWVQRFKARALVSTIGSKSASPPALVDQILASDECRPLYERMLNLQQQIYHATPGNLFSVRQELKTHIVAMRNCKANLLRQLLDFHEGKPLTSDDLENITQQGDGSVVLVDWFLSEVGDKRTFLLSTATARGAPTVDVLNTSFDDVEAWIARNDPDQDHAHLGGLVEPLRMHSKPGDILVFSPTSILHRIPLHALDILPSTCSEKSPVIYRNPVIYCHSHSLLRTCAWASNHASEACLSADPTFFHGIGDNNLDFEAGRKSITEVAASFNVSVLCGNMATKEILLRLLPFSRLIHIQTHGVWDPDNPLGHHLTLPDIEPSPLFSEALRDLPTFGSPDPDANNASMPSALSARDVFHLTLTPGTHFSMMACSGALTNIARGDEVTGLVPALLFAGASSTVATLWPVLDLHAGEFTKLFFKEYKHMSALGVLKEGRCLCGCGAGNHYFVNFARLMQRVVMALGKKYAEPVSKWAAFVMHGYWMYAVPPPRKPWYRRTLPELMGELRVMFDILRIMATT